MQQTRRETQKSSANEQKMHDNPTMTNTRG